MTIKQFEAFIKDSLKTFVKHRPTLKGEWHRMLQEFTEHLKDENLERSDNV